MMAIEVQFWTVFFTLSYWTSKMCCSIFVLGSLSLCYFFALLFQQRGALCRVWFYVSFSPPLFADFFASHFKNMMVPYQWPPKLHFESTMVPYQLPLWFMLRTRLWDCNKYTCRFFTLLFNNTNVFTVWCMNTCIHTYIQTDRQTQLALNTLMWGSLRFAPITQVSQCSKFCGCRSVSLVIQPLQFSSVCVGTIVKLS